VKGVIWCGGNVQGPPGFVHGECLSAVLDESMGVLVFAHMSNFQVTKGSFVKVSEKSSEIRCSISSLEGKILVQGVGEFASPMGMLRANL